MPAYLSDLLRYHNQDPSRDESKVVDYLCFCAERVGAWPPFPCTADKMVRFMFFITRARMLSGGWEQALGWHRAVVRWFAPVQKDPFDVVERAFYEHVRGSFAATVRQRRSPKAPMTTELFAAIWDYLDTGSELDEIERTLFLLYFVTGFRASTWALGSDRRGPQRLVRMENISFFNADEGPGQQANGPRYAFVVLPLTKTTAEWRPVGHTIRPRPDGDATRCAVARLYAHYQLRRHQGAGPGDPIFLNPRNGRAYSRNVFNAHLKTYVNLVASRYVLGRRLPLLPAAYISGISFRRGLLTRLASQGVNPTLIARFAHHRSINAQLAYVCETYEAPGVGPSHVYGSF